MISIDKVCYNSNLRYENAQQKMCYAVITLLICVGSQSFFVAMAVLGVNMYLIICKSGLSFRRFLHYMKIPLAFILFSTLSIVLNFSTESLDAFAILLPSVGNQSGIYLTCSVKGLVFAGRLILTALGSVSCLYFMSFTTTMPDILMVLRSWKVPALMIELMLLIYRYIFVLLELADSIRKAQEVRLGYQNYKTSLKSFGQLVSMLFIRAVKRSSILYDAMESRCYDGKINVLNESGCSQKRVKTYIILWCVILVALGMMEYGVGGYR